MFVCVCVEMGCASSTPMMNGSGGIVGAAKHAAGDVAHAGEEVLHGKQAIIILTTQNPTFAPAQTSPQISISFTPVFIKTAIKRVNTVSNICSAYIKLCVT